jgi:hypothetical protein
MSGRLDLNQTDPPDTPVGMRYLTTPLRMSQ